MILAEESLDRNTAFDDVVTKQQCSSDQGTTLPPTMPELANLHGYNLLQHCHVTEDAVLILERSTRGQAENDLWKQHRIGRITALRFHDVFTKMNTIQASTPGSVSVSSLLSLVMGYTEPNANIPALKYGRNMENPARHAYEKYLLAHGHQAVKVDQVGLFVDPDHSYLGASPDAFVSCSCCGVGVLEIKCPPTIADKAPSAKVLDYLKTRGDCEYLNRNHKYYDQCQGHLALTQLMHSQYCDFFVYTLHGVFYERLNFDSTHWAKIKRNLCSFFENYVLPELISGDLAATCSHRHLPVLLLSQ